MRSGILLQAVIVDDEKTIRDGLVSIVNWNELGYAVAGVFASGNQALEYISSHEVDLLLTDIKMPGMSGLELIEAVRKLGKKLQILILSGHDDFHFVKKALHHNAVDYILKPTDITELEKALSKAADQLTQEREDLIEEELARFEPYRDWLESVIEHAPTPMTRHIPRIATLEGLFFTLYFRFLSESDTLLKETVSTVCALDQEFLLLRRFEHDLVFSTVAPRDDSKAQKRVLDLADRILGVARTLGTGIRPIIAFSEGDSLEKTIIESYDICLYAFEDPKGQKKLHRLTSSFDTMQDSLTSFKDGMLELLATEQFSEALELTEHLFSHVIPRRRPASALVKNSCNQLVARTQELVSSRSLASGSLRTSTIDSLGIPQKVYSLTSLKEHLIRCVQTLQTIIESHSAPTRRQKSVQEMRIFIREHCSEPLSLQDLSERFSLSPDYISRIFKKETGSTVTEFIAVSRIEYAKELIRSYPTKPLHAIASMTGFSDVKYFSRVFKRVTGKTPTTYRQSLLI